MPPRTWPAAGHRRSEADLSVDRPRLSTLPAGLARHLRCGASSKPNAAAAPVHARGGYYWNLALVLVASGRLRRGTGPARAASTWPACARCSLRAEANDEAAAAALYAKAPGRGRRPRGHGRPIGFSSSRDIRLGPTSGTGPSLAPGSTPTRTATRWRRRCSSTRPEVVRQRSAAGGRDRARGHDHRRLGGCPSGRSSLSSAGRAQGGGRPQARPEDPLPLVNAPADQVRH